MALIRSAGMNALISKTGAGMAVAILVDFLKKGFLLIANLEPHPGLADVMGSGMAVLGAEVSLATHLRDSCRNGSHLVNRLGCGRYLVKYLGCCSRHLVWRRSCGSCMPLATML